MSPAEAKNIQMSKWRLSLAFLVSAVVAFVALWLLKKVPLPFIWISILGFFYFFSLVFLVPVPMLKKFFWNGMIVCVFFLAAESYCIGWLKWPEKAAPAAAAPLTPVEAKKNRADISTDYFLDDWQLGYRPKANTAFTYTYYNEGEFEFKNSFFIDACGHRNIPDHRPADHAENVALFFGDSQTFGIGVNNEETFPAQLEKLSGGKTYTMNFAFQAYGTQHALRILEKKIGFECAENLPPSLAVFTTNLLHVDWVNGQSEWVGGPRYELEPGGGVYYAGLFQNLLWTKMKRRLENSAALRAFMRTVNSRQRGVASLEQNLKLYLAILKQTRFLIENKYQGKFLLLYWNGMLPKRLPEDEKVLAALREAGFPVVALTEIIPDFYINRKKYVHSEGHGTPLTHRLLAEYLYQHAI